MSNKIPTPSQIRAALGALKWEYKDLSAASGVSVDALSLICLEKHEAQEKTRSKVRQAIESAGIEFLDNDGIRRVSKEVEIYVGKERFHEFTEFIYRRLLERGGDVCISAADETLFQKYRINRPLYVQRMNELVGSGKVSVRILATKSEFKSTFAKYKYQPALNTAPTAFYAFGDCLALVSFEHDDPPYVVLHKSGPFAQAYIQAFNLAWENAKAV